MHSNFQENKFKFDKRSQFLIFIFFFDAFSTFSKMMVVEKIQDHGLKRNKATEKGGASKFSIVICFILEVS